MNEIGYMTVAEDYFFTNNIEVLETTPSGKFVFFRTDEGEFILKSGILIKNEDDGTSTTVAGVRTMTNEEQAKVLLKHLDKYMQVNFNLEEWYLKGLIEGLKAIKKDQQGQPS